MDIAMKFVAFIMWWSLMFSLLALSAIADCQRFDMAKYKKKKLGNQKICNGNKCEKLSLDNLVKHYKHLFMTENEFKQREKKAKKNRDKYLKEKGVAKIEMIEELIGDGDTCCPTEVLVFTNTTMVNIEGVTQSIIHLSSLVPPQYQFIPHGECVDNGKCDGKCVIEPMILTMLVYDFDTSTVGFDYFQVPGYCSCKNVA